MPVKGGNPLKTSRGPAFLLLLASILLSSCGGTVLRTIGPVTATLVPNLALSATVPNGDISVLADLPDGSSLATAELKVLDAGMWGATFTPVSSDDIELFLPWIRADSSPRYGSTAGMTRSTSPMT